MYVSSGWGEGARQPGFGAYNYSLAVRRYYILRVVDEERISILEAKRENRLSRPLTKL